LRPLLHQVLLVGRAFMQQQVITRAEQEQQRQRDIARSKQKALEACRSQLRQLQRKKELDDARRADNNAREDEEAHHRQDARLQVCRPRCRLAC
jgi:hypothetical protein